MFNVFPPRLLQHLTFSRNKLSRRMVTPGLFLLHPESGNRFVHCRYLPVTLRASTGAQFLAENEQMRIPVEKDVAMLPNYPRKTISQRNQKKRISYRLPDKSRPSNTWAVKNLALPERFLKIRFTICFKHFSSLIFKESSYLSRALSMW